MTINAAAFDQVRIRARTTQRIERLGVLLKTSHWARLAAFVIVLAIVLVAGHL